MENLTLNISGIESARVTQILTVISAVTFKVRKICSEHENGVTYDEYVQIFNDEINRTAECLGITIQTCQDKLTRQLGLTKQEFIDGLFHCITRNGSITENSLAQRILAKITNKDDREKVRAALDLI